MINATQTLFFRNGTISTCGRKLHEIDLKWWRSQVGLVQQEPTLFNDTIFKNVEFGLVGTEWENASEEHKRELVAEACKEAYADEFISRLPQGYDTPCGEAGLKLSGGQRQRLAIARSIVRKPKVLILDEATSAIDVRSERIVQAALDKVSQNRTTIVIAHRLSTIKKADNIIVLKKGKVVQQGSHEELLVDKDGAYWALANAQQLSMDDEEPPVVPNSADRHSTIETITDDTSLTDIEEEKVSKNESYKPVGFLRSFSHILYEQRRDWFWYLVMVIGAAGAAGKSFVRCKVDCD
jgi:ATP-binding cassette, subfamily B (MDR/TAP), member 1